jgi:predicted RNA-binding Zn ribbon-like protein
MSTSLLPRPIVLAGHRALDFVNSRATPHGWVFDWLHDGAALVNWLAELGFFPEAPLRQLQREIAPAQLDEIAAEACALRESFREQLTDRARLRSNSRLWRSLNEVLARGASHQVLQRSAAAARLVDQEQLERPGQLLVPIAKAIARFIVEEDLTRLHACEGDGCSLWFLDQTKAGRRRFCSASACGNRAKVTAFRNRQRNRS